ncbi:hypothetical protein K3495_g6764 [Podosphaera aphanis]|nr:hypothetical protein K3495_g6764 [Podosphaera aphanis]
MVLRNALFARRERQKIYFLIDTQAAVSALKTGRSSSCLRLVRVFRDVAQKVKAEIMWVPRHSKIIGNEDADADAEARAALQRLPQRQTKLGYMTLAYLRRLMHQRWQSLIDDWWSSVYPARYWDLDLQRRRRKLPELNLPWRLLHKLIAVRTGHGDFVAYHRRFNHINAILNCARGQETSPTHFIHCRRYANQVRTLRKGATMSDSTAQLLGPRCFENFKELTSKKGCFGRFSAHTSSTECEERI